MRTLSSLMRMFNESNAVIDYLKLDIEESEWTALVEIHASGVLSQVRQLALEVHVERNTRIVDFYNFYKIVRLLDDAHMLRWYFAINLYNLRDVESGWRSCCYEMVFINRRFFNGRMAGVEN